MYPRVTEQPDGTTKIKCACGWERTVPAGGIQFTQAQRLRDLHAQEHEHPDFY